MAEELDVPVGIRIGLGPPGAAYRGAPEYRMRLSNPLLLENVILRHPKLRVYICHAGWPFLPERSARSALSPPPGLCGCRHHQLGPAGSRVSYLFAWYCRGGFFGPYHLWNRQYEVARFIRCRHPLNCCFSRRARNVIFSAAMRLAFCDWLTTFVDPDCIGSIRNPEVTPVARCCRQYVVSCAMSPHRAQGSGANR